MPNWCMTRYEVIDTKKSLDNLEKKLHEALSDNPLKADFGNGWLGNLMLFIGVSEDTVVHGTANCRGELYDIERTSDYFLSFWVESAWSPANECVSTFVKTFAPNASILYVAEESGCELYWTNDPDVLGTVHIDRWEDGEGTIPEHLRFLFEGENEVSQDELFKNLAPIYGCLPLDALIARAEADVKEPSYLYMNTYDFHEL